jgi:hypothetical protein
MGSPRKRVAFVQLRKSSTNCASAREPAEAMNNKPDDDMRAEYDLRGGVRGKYQDRYKQGTNVVLLEPDLAKLFRDSATVNSALRVYLAEHGEPPPSVERKAG